MKSQATELTPSSWHRRRADKLAAAGGAFRRFKRGPRTTLCGRGVRSDVGPNTATSFWTNRINAMTKVLPQSRHGEITAVYGCLHKKREGAKLAQIGRRSVRKAPPYH